MAPTWPQYWPSHLLFHYFSVVLDTLFSENSNHFRILKAKIWYKWPEHGFNLGLILPHYAQNCSTLSGSDLFEMHALSAKELTNSPTSKDMVNSKVTHLNLGLKSITFVVKNHMETATGIEKVI